MSNTMFLFINYERLDGLFKYTPIIIPICKLLNSKHPKQLHYA